jgi:hypothetical protein
MAAHRSRRTTKLCDRTKERLNQDEVERIMLSQGGRRYSSLTSIELRSHHILKALSSASASKSYH